MMIFLIIINDILVINIKFIIMRGRDVPPKRRGNLKPHHQRGRGVTPERGGNLKPHRRRGEESLNCVTR
jgi:hypothetical protein